MVRSHYVSRKGARSGSIRRPPQAKEGLSSPGAAN